MSPGTGLLAYLAQHGDQYGIVVDQAEDEIAAINQGLGAWYAGARAVVTTSGGGFTLMTEGISLSGMIETPIVVHIGQRPGPATGLPTRTEQGDLNLALYAGHGEFPRAIFAPGSVEEAFLCMQQAFEVADRFQVPVIVLTDQFLLDSTTTVHPQDLVTVQWKNHFIRTSRDYQRYTITKEGVSPRGIPGYGTGLVGVDSDEHDTDGHITESQEIRLEQHEKRLRKYDGLLEETIAPVVVGNNKKAKIAVVTWGSNLGPVGEALEILDDPQWMQVHFSQVYPLSPVGKKLLEKKSVVVVENNAGGQFAHLLEREYGIRVQKKVLQYDGNPFAVEDLVSRLRKLK